MTAPDIIIKWVADGGAGGDTVIAAAPPDLLSAYNDLDHWEQEQLREGVDAANRGSNPLIKFLATMSDDMALRLGDTMHRAEYWITNDPKLVQDRAIMPQHDGCDSCEAGRTTALAYLEHNPDGWIVLGHLYWAAA